MAHKDEQNELLSRPLYIFDLPEELLLSLTLKNLPTQAQQLSVTTPSPQLPEPSLVSEQTSSTISTSTSPPKSTSCSLCALKFPTPQEQRNHVRSDLHNYNLKQRMRGLPSVSEADFERLIGDLDESISGSETESESDEEQEKGKDGMLATLLKRQAKISGASVAEDVQDKTNVLAGSPLAWFKSDKVPSNTSLGVYKAIFSKEEQEEPAHLVDVLRKKQIPSTMATKKNTPAPAGGKLNPHYFMCMMGGGHFAAIVVSLAAKVSKNSGRTERQADVLAHKTFHRYTTRRKQGGAQSASDAAKGAAHSAGSSLRRYNEAALTNEVRQLLTEWKGLIDSADLLFIRATGSTSRQTLFSEYEGRVMRQNDPRIRGFPFSTRRATQSELMRAFVELTRVKVSEVDEAALAAAEEKERARLAEQQTKSASQKAAKQPKLTEEEETAAMHTTQLQSLIRRSKAPALVGYLKSNDLSADFTFYPEMHNHHSPTPLHLASSLSSPALITALLVKAKADPTKRNADGRTAYDIAGDRASRDAFRAARHTLGEKAWDWDAADVPAALSPEELSKRTEQEKNEKKIEDAKEAERRKAELQRIEQEAEDRETGKKEKKFGKGKTLAGAEKSGAEKREEEARGMTPEMRMKLERERRARAAEERMRRLQGGN